MKKPISMSRWRRWTASIVAIAAVADASGCGWRGLNSLPLPGTEGNGPGSYVIQAQMPDVNNIQSNSRVRVADVTVGHVTKIERQGWHALVTMQLDRDVYAARECHGQDRHDQLAGLLPHRARITERRSTTRQVTRRLGHPAVTRCCLPEHRADIGGAVLGAQRWRTGPDAGHHRSVEHRLSRP